MSATQARTRPSRWTTSETGRLASALRTERTIALIRICVLAVVLSVYLGSLGIRRTPAPLAIFLLGLAIVYAFACLLISASEEASSTRLQVATLVIDACLITIWVQVTGGAQSEFWFLYLLIIFAVALRFGMIETIAVSVALAALHALALAGADELGSAQLHRPTLIIVMGFAAGVLSLQRLDQERRRREMEALAGSRARQLGKERAEVARLRRIDLASSEFVGVAAHELRTPLAGIVGVLSTLKDHGAAIDDDVRVELIEGAEAQAQRLSRLVEDLLTVSRIEDGMLRLSLEPVEAADLVHEAVVASGTSGRVQVELGEVEPVVCDGDALVRVLTNLLDNARKYSPEGTPIAVSVSQDGSRVRFAVRDGGPGIPEAERDTVFERFRRANGSGKRGAGLGLYICRGLVQAHGGSIEIADAPGGGAELLFWLPRRPPGERAVEVGGSRKDETEAGRSREDETEHLEPSEV